MAFAQRHHQFMETVAKIIPNVKWYLFDQITIKRIDSFIP